MQHDVLDQIYKDYAAHLQAERRLAPDSRRIYLAAARDLLATCRARPGALLLPPEWTLADVDRRALQIYLNHLRDDRGWAPASLRLQATALRSLFAFLAARGHLGGGEPRNPARGLVPRVPARTPQVPEGEAAAVRRLFARRPATLAQARLILLLQLLYGGGLRPGQAYAVQAVEPRDAEGVLVLHRAGEAPLELPAPPGALRRARAYVRLRAAVVGNAQDAPFWVDHLGRACAPERLARQVKQAMGRVGLTGGPSALRQLAARHFAEQGGDIRSLRRLLGARSLGRLDRYAPPDFAGVQALYRRIHPRQQARD